MRRLRPEPLFVYCDCNNHTALISFFFFFNDTATTEIYTLSLHDALPILPAYEPLSQAALESLSIVVYSQPVTSATSATSARSEEHTSELQSQSNLVCRLLLEKKKKDIARRGMGERNAYLHPTEEHFSAVD